MQTSLRVLSINFPFEEAKVEQAASLASRTSFSEFDVIVIRPPSISQVLQRPVRRIEGDNWVEGSDFVRAEALLIRNRPELLRFLHGGGLLVVILNTIESLLWDPYDGARLHLGERRKLTNYDFLDRRFRPCVHNGGGVGISIVDEDDPFANVIRNSRIHWKAYLHPRPLGSLNNPRILARNANGSAVGARLEFSRGEIVFLPNFEQLHENSFLAACAARGKKEETAAPPTWVDSVYLPGEGQMTDTITCLQFDIHRLQEERASLLGQREGLLEFKSLLYEGQRARLEPAVRNALDELGFHTAPPEVLPESGLEIHGRTLGGSMPGILEVRSSNQQITGEALSEFIPKIQGDLTSAGIRSKGILVGNGFCEEPPEERIGARIFSDDVVKSARFWQVALVNSVELFWVMCRVFSKEITCLNAVRELILLTSGYVDLLAFCGQGISRRTTSEIRALFY